MIPFIRSAAWALLVLLLIVPSALAADPPLLPSRSVWKYLDTGIAQPASWTTVGFDDSRWSSGPAELGYGDGDEATVVGFGPDPSRRYITTYFRQKFEVPSPGSIGSLRLRLIRDDGAVVYINGVEVFRNNMPAGPIGFNTPASSTVSDDAEGVWVEATIAAHVLVAGTNVVAVEVHQAGASSSDLSFAFELLGDAGQATPDLLRGPYLQQGTPTSVIVRWRTGQPSDSVVRFGTSPGNLTRVATRAGSTTEHEVTVTGLQPATRYYYEVGTSLARVGGGDDRYHFLTSPPAGTPARTRIWVLGDSGTGDAKAMAVRNAYYARGGRDATELILMLGDNAYTNATDREYQRAVFDMYPEVLRKAVVWTTIGNHETAQLTDPSPTIPYFQVFTLPTGAEAGGVPSGTEKYYSFDYGNIHFICLDSMTSDRSPNGPMLTWLRDDLAATTAPWIIAFWHHPPYSKGSHDSDTSLHLVEMRQNAVPILEQGGADLILAGHSHSYERSFFMNGHYGHSSTFRSSMKVIAGDGRAVPYTKGTTATPNYVGTVYAVTGSAGTTTGGPLNHPAMVISLNELGSMVLDVSGSVLDATFLRETGAIDDSFRIDKRQAATSPPEAPGAASAVARAANEVRVTWTDALLDQTSFRIERCTGASCTNFQPVGATEEPSFTDRGVAPSTTYRYRVLALNGAGASAPSNTAQVTTPSGQYPRRRAARS